MAKELAQSIQIDKVVTVDQLPVITEQLESVKDIVEARVLEACAMECTEDTYKVVKQMRAALNKEFGQFETKRKSIRDVVMAPLQDFDDHYKDYIKDPYSKADKILGERITTVENSLRAAKEKDIRAFFSEYLQSLELDPEWITWERTGFHVRLSDSKKSLTEQARNFLDGVKTDLDMIATQDHADEIMVEYRKSLNAGESVVLVANRHKAMAREQAKREAAEKERQRQLQEERERQEAEARAAADQEPEIITAPVVVTTPEEEPAAEVQQMAAPAAEVQRPEPAPEEKLYQWRIHVVGTQAQLVALRNYLNNGGYHYDKI